MLSVFATLKHTSGCQPVLVWAFIARPLCMRGLPMFLFHSVASWARWHSLHGTSGERFRSSYVAKTSKGKLVTLYPSLVYFSLSRVPVRALCVQHPRIYGSVPLDFPLFLVRATDGKKSMKIAVGKAEANTKSSLGAEADCLQTSWVCICHVLVAYLVSFPGELLPS